MLKRWRFGPVCSGWFSSRCSSGGDDGGSPGRVVAAALFLYGAWALAGWVWLVPPGVVIITHGVMLRRGGGGDGAGHGVVPILALSAPGLGLLVVRAVEGAQVWGLYVAAFAAGLSVLIGIRLRARGGVGVGRFVAGVMMGTMVVVMPSALAMGLQIDRWDELLVTALSASLTACAGVFMTRVDRVAGGGWVWLRRGAALMIGLAVAVWVDRMLAGSW